jgi:hypothetical protein
MMIKKLRFAPHLVPLVIAGSKTITWRINDDKALDVNDELSLCHTNNEEFAKAKILWVKNTTFEHLTPEDKGEHEKFYSNEEMYKTYSGYYNMKVDAKTVVKIIKFKLL